MNLIATDLIVVDKDSIVNEVNNSKVNGAKVGTKAAKSKS